MLMRIYDRDGRAIDLGDYAERLNDPEYRQVARDDVDGLLVSTVWLGVDHSFGEGGRPIIFETMVFGPDGNDEWMDRYSTEEEALLAHHAIVAALRTGGLAGLAQLDRHAAE